MTHFRLKLIKLKNCTSVQDWVRVSETRGCQTSWCGGDRPSIGLRSAMWTLQCEDSCFGSQMEALIDVHQSDEQVLAAQRGCAGLKH